MFCPYKFLGLNVYLAFNRNDACAGVAEMADARDLKSRVL
jgi:hypothetical protein